MVQAFTLPSVAAARNVIIRMRLNPAPKRRPVCATSTARARNPSVACAIRHQTRLPRDRRGQRFRAEYSATASRARASTPKPVACRHQGILYSTSQTPLSRRLAAGGAGAPAAISRASTPATLAATGRPIRQRSAAAAEPAPASSARIGRHDPHTREAPVRATRSSTEAHPAAAAALNLPRVISKQLQTTAGAGHSATGHRDRRVRERAVLVETVKLPRRNEPSLADQVLREAEFLPGTDGRRRHHDPAAHSDLPVRAVAAPRDARPRLPLVAQRPDVDADQPQPHRRRVAPEPAAAARQDFGQRLGHAKSGRRQAVDDAGVRRALADGLNGRILCPQLVVDDNPARSGRHLQPGIPRQLAARAHASGEDDEPGNQRFRTAVDRQDQVVATRLDPPHLGAGRSSAPPSPGPASPAAPPRPCRAGGLGGPRLLADDGDVVAPDGAQRSQPFDELVADHAEAGHHEARPRRGGNVGHRGQSTMQVVSPRDRARAPEPTGDRTSRRSALRAAIRADQRP